MICNPMLMDVFKKTLGLVRTADRMKKLSAQMSGTTATVCSHELGIEGKTGRITLGHVADSTAVLGKHNEQGNCEGKHSCVTTSQI